MNTHMNVEGEMQTEVMWALSFKDEYFYTDFGEFLSGLLDQNFRDICSNWTQNQILKKRICNGSVE